LKIFKIEEKKIGLAFKPFIIAEMSGNHNGSIKRALNLIKIAKEAGADAIKLQTYTADTLTLNIPSKEFLIKDKKSLWFGKTLHSLYEEASLPWEWHEQIFSYCKKLKLICFSSPFDSTAVDFLESFNVPAYKIASPEIIDHGLIEKVAKTKKPIIISTGMANLKEISEAIKVCHKYGNKKIAILHCNSTYPTNPNDMNLKTIESLRKKFKCEVGLSDHSTGIGIALASIPFGATIIEKHFTDSKANEGVDSAFSLESNELSSLVKESFKVYLAIGKEKFGPTRSENSMLFFRRSLYIVEDITKGDKFTNKNIRSIRPAKGAHPKFLKKFLGKKAKKSLKRGTPASLDMI
tara:strand:- start:4540 stop:5589 length:1050 start_codon:yes stop_codon:yes gene_type:complete